jgi:antitoxin CptB
MHETARGSAETAQAGAAAFISAVNHYMRFRTPTCPRVAVGRLAMGKMDRKDRLNRLRFRAWHRGVREADMLIGGYFDRWHEAWTDGDLDWFEALLEEQDIDILAWATASVSVPERWQGPMMRRLQALDYIRLPQ